MLILFIISNNFFIFQNLSIIMSVKEMRKRDLKLCLQRFFLIIYEYVILRTDLYPNVCLKMQCLNIVT